MTIPTTLINLLAFIGLISTVHVLGTLIKYAYFWLKFNKIPKNLTEEKLELIRTENVRLQEQIAKGERELEEMTKAVIQRLR